MDQFISKNKLKWVPYDKFVNIEYLDKGGFGTIYKAKYNSIEVILKYFDYLNNSDESLNESLNEWKIIISHGIIRIYGFTKDPVTLNYVLMTGYTNKGSLKRCLKEITKNWKQKLFHLYQIIKGLNDIHKYDITFIMNKKIEDINEELKSNIMEFINAPIEHNNLIVKSHPKACYTSHLLDFTSEELNEILEDSQGFLKFLKQNYQSS
ncbi:unnamed protein product [Rhizophagus irregularis]|nr:unnamed protein product [Rhizophagus irregularis]